MVSTLFTLDYGGLPKGRHQGSVQSFVTPFLQSLLTNVSDLTPQHIELLEEEALTTPSKFARLSASDLKGILGCKMGLASDLLTFAHEAKDGDFSTGKASETAAVQTLLEDLMGSDESRTSAVKALLERGVSFVVANHHGLQMTTETLALIKSPDRAHAERQRLWREMKVVAVISFLPKKVPLRSPVSGEALVEGEDWRTGIAWGLLTQEVLGLAVWFYQEKMDGGRAQTEIFADFQNEGPLRVRAARIAAAKGLSSTDLQELALFKEIPIQAPVASPAPKSGGLREVHDLILAVFSGDELRRFAHNYLSIKPHQLPGPNENPAKVGDEILRIYLADNGTLDAHFWEKLLGERPRRRPEIARLAASFGIRI